MKIKRSLWSFIVLMILCAQVWAQEKSISAKVEEFQQTFPIEKIYLSFDRPYYSVGDTIYFKSYLLNGNLTASSRSMKIYVELFNDSLQLVERKVIALNNGLGYGDFTLKKSLSEGTYCIRAYSNWQQNFGENYFFTKNFYVGGAGGLTWQLNGYQKLNTADNSTSLHVNMKLSDLDNLPLGLKDLDIYLRNKKRRLMHLSLRTTADGRIETTIPLPNKLDKNHNIFIVDKNDKSKNALLPIALQEADEVDLQFMPEGGYMVNGLYGKIAFKAIGTDGLGKNIVGKILDSKNQEILSFSTLHKGMGSFFLLPQSGENYTAVYILNSKEFRQSLPKAKDEGTTLRIDHLSRPDSMLVYVRASAGKRSDGYHFLAQSTGDVLMDAKINLTPGFSTFKLPKRDFPDGIVHFTLFSPENTAVNERQALLNRQQKIILKTSPSKISYGQRDSIHLEITAMKEDGTPVAGSFSISVTDDQQIKQPLNDGNITSYFFLESDLKGNIEDPGWYFGDDPSVNVALDHLLLTQGWVGYNWNGQLSAVSNPKFLAETTHKITGKLTDLFKKPAANIKLTLLSFGRNIYSADTISNSNGEFSFPLPSLDSAAYSIKIKNAKGRTSSANIHVDEFTAAPPVTEVQLKAPFNLNPDTTSLNFYKNTKKIGHFKDSAVQKLAGNQLKEVEIKGKTTEKIKNVAWDAYPFKKISEEELKRTPQKRLMDLLREKITGFTIGDTYANGCFGLSARVRKHEFVNFLVGNVLISHVLIDKINTHIVSCGIDDVYNETQVSATATEADVFFANETIFNAINAADVKEIVVYKTCAYYMLDITTRSGSGPWVGMSKGTYVFRPQPFHIPKEFYSPKYPLKKDNAIPDLRPTVFWDANLATDEKGKASLSFYSTDQPGSYTVTIEGTDMMGRFGHQKSKINITAVKQSK